MNKRHLINYCRNCGHAVEHRVPDDGDTHVRAVCPACHTIHYLNPLNVVGTVPVWQDKILLCKRNIEPRMGKWTLPAGFMELDETTAEGAARETREEAGIEVVMGRLFSVISVPRVGQVHLFYLAQMTGPEVAPGPETQQAVLYAEEEIPWAELAFQTTRVTLEHFFADRRAGRFDLHDLALD
ncbi:ADP-ribose pyrophosphatase [Lampropedia cohaerens]|uniref:ADP-ribose pyrophosphatase n=1 Tax=Lampropedia cohaerens TaxID=1610491 RepID=A0A0U1PYA8_9BURK|nr:NUDIX hydrolase [Lampropedia cohaerens]KKW67446.1 ADP-ribose pyrophosphatase [Lampropedia cohaerens]